MFNCFTLWYSRGCFIILTLRFSFMLESLFAAFFGLLFGSLGAVIVSMDMWLWGGLETSTFTNLQLNSVLPQRHSM